MKPKSVLPASSRVRVRRFSTRGAYDRQSLYAVLDAGILCQIAFVFEGSPFAIPTLYWRDGARLYFHGSPASRMLKQIEARQVCVSVTHLDGLVLTRSAFHHSANYRSATILGIAEVVVCPEERLSQMRKFVEKIYPGRWEMLRPIKPSELRATRIMSVAIDEFSVKSRVGGPEENHDDLRWPAWGGVIPLAMRRGEVEPDEHALSAGIEPPGFAFFNSADT